MKHSPDQIDTSFFDPWVVGLIQECGFKKWTEIQELVLPELCRSSTRLKSDDMIVAPTGSGKTLAYTLPILQDLNREKYGVHTLILVPTVELVTQVADQVALFGQPIDCRIVKLSGGNARHNQVKDLKQNPNVVIGTIGRTLDLLHEPEVRNRFKKLKYLVLDEADELVSHSNIDSMKQIINILPSAQRRKLILCSATIDTSVVEFQNEFGRSGKLSKHCSGLLNSEQAENDHMHKHADINKDQLALCLSKTLTHYFIICRRELRLAHVIYLLEQQDEFRGCKVDDPLQFERDRGVVIDEQGKRTLNSKLVKDRNVAQGIIFVDRSSDATYLKHALEELKFPAVELHGDMLAEERRSAMLDFKRQKALILVATDVASRGLDVPSVKWVINYG